MVHADEPILDASNQMYTMFPIRHHDIWEMYKKAVSAFWTLEELDFSTDRQHWNGSLSDNERHFVKHVLAFFASSDGIVNENLGVRFMNEVALPEAKAFYGFQIAMENIHNETYSAMIESYISDPDEKDALFRAVELLPCVKAKAEWALRWISSESASFAERLLAFACVEGIFFSGAFCSIFWLKERGLMPGLTTSNEFISRDESLHTEFAILLYKKLLNRLPEARVHAIVREAVEIEVSFITDALPCNLLGMNAELMGSYIEFVADRLLVQLGYPKIFEVKNPFAFMDRIGMDSKANFFEHRESNYSKMTSSNGTLTHSKVFSTDSYF
jgi:ribonucleotide reductase beta subunit family protein with ferritin-like domain